tara:strand:- start:776 stop:886 length:111 start_codon:yes stop_codon:yes gene_type:complete
LRRILFLCEVALVAAIVIGAMIGSIVLSLKWVAALL